VASNSAGIETGLGAGVLVVTVGAGADDSAAGVDGAACGLEAGGDVAWFPLGDVVHAARRTTQAARDTAVRTSRIP
jgi:hypothetical protein